MLSDAKLRTLKPREKLYRVADAGGLCVEVTPQGSKLWRLRYRIHGRPKMISLGAYPETGLAAARAARDAAKALVRDQVDPSAVRRERRLAAAEASLNTFEAVASEWLEKQRHGMAAATYRKAQWMLGLAHSQLGRLPLREITPQKALACLRSIEAVDQRHETAHRVKGRISQVFRYAIACGKADADPTASLKGALSPVVSTPRAAVTDPARIGALLRAIDGYNGSPLTRLALQLAPMVFVRPGELRGARWEEFDLEAGEWRIPGQRMKMREEHLVPLSVQAVAVLRDLHQLSGHRTLVFPGMASPKRPMSENTVNSALRRMGFEKDEMSGHGFRALASTRLNEMGWSPDVIERQLAHVERNKVRAAYNRAQHLAERRKMMQAWSDYLMSLKSPGSTVTPIRSKSA